MSSLENPNSKKRMTPESLKKRKTPASRKVLRRLADEASVSGLRQGVGTGAEKTRRRSGTGGQPRGPS